MDQIDPAKEPRIKDLFAHGTEDAEITSWRMFRIIAELIGGFELLRKYKFAATIYGSARAPDWSHEYAEAEKLGKLLAGEGFSVITGGGGGIMRAANKGAYEAGGNSVGLNIKLPHEQHLNGFVNNSFAFSFFFTRKIALAFASEVYIFFPGGHGTLDELFEIVTLVQTGKISPVPVILVGREYWTPLLSWLATTARDKYQYISDSDLSIMELVDSADEAHEHIRSLLKK